MTANARPSVAGSPLARNLEGGGKGRGRRRSGARLDDNDGAALCRVCGLRVCVCNSGIGTEGVGLAAADAVVSHDLDWSPGALARWRAGLGD